MRANSLLTRAFANMETAEKRLLLGLVQPIAPEYVFRTNILMSFPSRVNSQSKTRQCNTCRRVGEAAGPFSKARTEGATIALAMRLDSYSKHDGPASVWESDLCRVYEASVKFSPGVCVVDVVECSC